MGAPGTAQRHKQLMAGSDDISTKLTLQLRGPCGPRPAQVVEAIRSEVGKALGKDIVTVDPEAALTAYRMRPERGVVVGALTGKVELAVGTQQEGRHLHELLHGRGLQLGANMVSLEAGNGSRC